VRDTGVGLAPDEIKQVFELFYQAPQPLDRPRGGLRVGLSLAQRLVGLHDGTITARSAAAKAASSRSACPSSPNCPRSYPPTLHRPACAS